MSGTSLDGVDLCISQFEFKNQKWSYKILATQTIPYTREWALRLNIAHQLSAKDFLQIDFDYSSYLAELCNDFLAKTSTDIDFISSHGHTIFHNPAKNWGFQLGNHPVFAVKTNHTFVCDFRRQDLAMGGQGAPLVPIGDELLFSDFDACLNLGGFANISYKENGKRLAFDVCPINVLLNSYARKLGFEFDNKGEIAKSGKTIDELFLQLEKLAFYKQIPPKSLGIEWVSQEIEPILQKFSKHKPEDILHTLVVHFSTQISKSLAEKTNCLVTGGGAYNLFLVEQIQKKTSCLLVVPSDELINHKESLVFGFLGVLRTANQINVLKSVTGATSDHCSGVIYQKPF